MIQDTIPASELFATLMQVPEPKVKCGTCRFWNPRTIMSLKELALSTEWGWCSNDEVAGRMDCYDDEPYFKHDFGCDFGEAKP